MSLSIISAQFEPTAVNAGGQYFLRVKIADTLEGWLLLRDKNIADLRGRDGKYLFVEG